MKKIWYATINYKNIRFIFTFHKVIFYVFYKLVKTPLVLNQEGFFYIRQKFINKMKCFLLNSLKKYTIPPHTTILYCYG